MVKKILIVIIDDTSELSKELSYKLSLINKNHLYCQINDVSIIDEIKSGTYRYINKLFLTSSCDIIFTLSKDKDLSVYPIVYIGSSPPIRLPVGIEIFSDINEIILRYMVDGYDYYSNKEIKEIISCVSHNEYIKVDLDIIITGNICTNVTLSSLRKIILFIKNNRPYPI